MNIGGCGTSNKGVAKFICAPPGRFDDIFAGGAQEAHPMGDHDLVADDSTEDAPDLVGISGSSAGAVNSPYILTAD